MWTAKPEKLLSPKTCRGYNLAACLVFPFLIEICMLLKNFISDPISPYCVMHSWLFVFTLFAWSLKTTVIDTNLNSIWGEQSLGLPLFQTLILESLSTSHGNWRHGVWEPRLEWVSWWENACTLTEWGYGSRIKCPGWRLEPGNTNSKSDSEPRRKTLFLRGDQSHTHWLRNIWIAWTKILTLACHQVTIITMKS